MFQDARRSVCAESWRNYAVVVIDDEEVTTFSDLQKSGRYELEGGTSFGNCEAHNTHVYGIFVKLLRDTEYVVFGTLLIA